MRFTKIKQTGTALALLMTFLGGNVLGATSSTTISTNQSSAQGANISISAGQNTYLTGSNYSSSTNDVWIQKVHSQAGFDSVTFEYRLGPGLSQNRVQSPTNSTGNYYVKMNPAGALAHGVNGSASLSN